MIHWLTGTALIIRADAEAVRALGDDLAARVTRLEHAVGRAASSADDNLIVFDFASSPGRDELAAGRERLARVGLSVARDFHVIDERLPEWLELKAARSSAGRRIIDYGDDPDFVWIRDWIAEELEVRVVDMGNVPRTPEDCGRLADLISANVVVNATFRNKKALRWRKE